MHARATAILVARDDAGELEGATAALVAQTRRPDRVVGVDAGGDEAARLGFAAADPEVVVSVGRRPFGAAVDTALTRMPELRDDDDWLWLLTQGDAPLPTALESLLGAVEVAPSVAVAGPKLVRADDADVIASYGETLTTRGDAVQLVADELDQAQYDRRSDVLAVAASGMLVRASVWRDLGGFDPGLPDADAALDFCLRARLAGHRVIGVPQSRVAVASPDPVRFHRPRARAGTRARIARRAKLHRRLVYAPGPLVPLIWLGLVPAAVLRALAALVLGRPELIGPELAAAVGAALDTSVLGARRRFRGRRRAGWATVAPLRMTPAEAQQLREIRTAAPTIATDRRPSFARVGVWVVAAALVGGLVLLNGILGATALSGGALVPLSPTITELWSSVLYGPRAGIDALGAADPFTGILALLGSVTAWSPSTSIVVLHLVALPLAALGGWFATSHLVARAPAAVLGAVVWALAPPLLVALETGRLPAVIAHLALPWLVVATLRAVRTWSASGAAALLFAVVVACSPSLAPALLVAAVVMIVARPRAAARFVVVPIPAAVLFGPLALDQVMRGTPLALLADPGVVAPFTPATGVELLAFSPIAGLSGWMEAAALVGLDPAVAAVVGALLLAPLVLLALAAPVLRPSALPALGLGVLGMLTAVAVGRLPLAHLDGATVTVWPGAALSLALLGATLAACVAVDRSRRAGAPVAGVAALAVAAAVAPLLAAPFLAGLPVGPSTGRLLPAFVAAEAVGEPSLGTLVITPTGDDAIAVDVQRGAGATLDRRSTLHSTRAEASASDLAVAEAAGNLVRSGSLDPRPVFDQEGIRFVLLERGTGGASARSEQLVADALDGTAVLVPVGQTPAGLLWRTTSEQPVAAAAVPPIAGVIVAVQAAVIGLTLLLAVPIGTRTSRTGQSRARHSLQEDDDD